MNTQPHLPGSEPRPLSMTGWRRRLAILMSNGRNEGPPDLDELWRDFNRKLGGLFGGRGGSGRPPESRGDGPSFQPDMKSAGVGVGLIGVVVALIWAGSGFFIVQEGQQAIITTFGRYSNTVHAGFQWRLPYPIQEQETIPVTQLRTMEVGRNSIGQTTGLRDSSMLTQDETIIDILFTVQYRLKDAKSYLFDNRDPDKAVEQASESAVREIVGRSQVDSVLYEQRDAIATDLVKSIQLDHLECISDAGVRHMAAAGVVAVSLPFASLYLGQAPLPARRLLEAGVPVAVATDFNPGSAPSYHLPVAMTLACTMQRMTPAEVLHGATAVAARALALGGVTGSIVPGLSADFAVLEAESVNHWLYHLRENACVLTVARGQVVWRATAWAAPPPAPARRPRRPPPGPPARPPPRKQQ